MTTKPVVTTYRHGLQKLSDKVLEDIYSTSGWERNSSTVSQTKSGSIKAM